MREDVPTITKIPIFFGHPPRTRDITPQIRDETIVFRLQCATPIVTIQCLPLGRSRWLGYLATGFAAAVSDVTEVENLGRAEAKRIYSVYNQARQDEGLCMS